MLILILPNFQGLFRQFQSMTGITQSVQYPAPVEQIAAVVYTSDKRGRLFKILTQQESKKCGYTASVQFIVQKVHQLGISRTKSRSQRLTFRFLYEIALNIWADRWEQAIVQNSTFSQR